MSYRIFENNKKLTTISQDYIAHAAQVQSWRFSCRKEMTSLIKISGDKKHQHHCCGFGRSLILIHMTKIAYASDITLISFPV